MLFDYTAVSHYFGTSITISAKQSSDHLLNLRPYLEHCVNGSGLVLWPIVTRLDIQCCSPVLSTGIVLVDLPSGITSEVVKSRRSTGLPQHYNQVIAVVPITKALSQESIETIEGTHHLCFPSSVLPSNFLSITRHIRLHL